MRRDSFLPLSIVHLFLRVRVSPSHTWKRTKPAGSLGCKLDRLLKDPS